MNKFKNPILVNSISILICFLLIVSTMLPGQIAAILDFAVINTVEAYGGCMFGNSLDDSKLGVIVMSIFLVFLLRRLYKHNNSNSN